MRTPTTVARAAPELKPNRLIAAATASSKKFDAPISAEGPATQCCSPARRLTGRPACVEIDLDQDRHGQQGDDERLRQDLFALEAEQQHQGGEQGDQRHRAEGVQQPIQAACPPEASRARRTSCATSPG